MDSSRSLRSSRRKTVLSRRPRSRERATNSGKWEVDSVAMSDDKKSFYLTTSEGSPFERHLYRMPVGGGASAKLTSMPGDNEAVISSDGNAIANVYSYTNKPPELYIG